MIGGAMIKYLLSGLVNFFIALAELFLGLRVILRLFAANPDVQFVQWIYNSSDVLLSPFRGIFPTTTIAPDHLLDFSALFAMVVYGLIGLALLALINLLVPHPISTTSHK
jgi:uncharacterized protein YggT (Ycf19 family)